MIRKTGKIKIFLLSVVFLSLFSLKANASVLYSQPVSDTISAMCMGYCGGDEFVQTLGTGLSGTVEKIKLKVQWNGTPYSVGGNTTFLVQLFDTTFNTNVVYQQIILTESIILNEPTYLELTPQTPPGATLSAEQDYFLYFVEFGQYQSQFPFIFGSAAPESWANGSYGIGSYQNPYSQTSDDNVKDIYFELDSAEIVPEIALKYPLEAASIQDFDNWILDYSAPLVIQEPPFYTIFVSYGLADGDFSYSDYFFLDGGEVVDYSLQKRSVFTDGDWKAKAEMYAGENLVAVSDTVFFTIDNVFGSGTPPPPPPPEVECGPTDFVCQLTQWITSSFQTLLNFLFVPSAQSVNNFKTLLSPIENKPPIGYFNIIKNELSGLSGGTAPFELSGSDEISSVFEPLRTGISFCLWFIFAIWLLKRITNLEI